MADVAYFTSAPAPRDHGPDPKAKRVKRLNRRRETIVTQVFRLLTAKTHGSGDRLLARFETVGRLYAEYQRVTNEIIALELL